MSTGDGHDRLLQWLTGDSLNQERDRFSGNEVRLIPPVGPLVKASFLCGFLGSVKSLDQGLIGLDGGHLALERGDGRQRSKKIRSVGSVRLLLIALQFGAPTSTINGPLPQLWSIRATDGRRGRQERSGRMGADALPNTGGECWKDDEYDRSRQRMEPTDRSQPEHNRILARVPRDGILPPDARGYVDDRLAAPTRHASCKCND
jgi:hypothetical protein